MDMSCHGGGAKALFDADLEAGAIGLAWLGQAGFAVKNAGCRILIDPYLSDHLAHKYRGAEFPHVRLMPPPITADSVRDLGWVLCSHRHSDHMDPGSLKILASQNPGCQFVVPRAEREHALSLGLPAAQMMPVNAGDQLSLGDGLEMTVLPSAHEVLKRNERGDHHFLGFVLSTPAATLYHSGDCVVYDGLAQALQTLHVDLALLPVNGRDAHRASRGVPGNMTFAEARQLCSEAGIPEFVAHHFGMFGFNTVPIEELRRQAAQPGPRALIPSTDHFWIVTSNTPATAPRP